MTAGRSARRQAPEERFAATLDRLVPEGELGIAVSGGPDSLALLLLAARARPGRVRAATVDHGLRAESASEAAMVAEVCAALEVPHTVLHARLHSMGNLQARARQARYDLLLEWMVQQGLAALATAHHADDQAETLLMRLARGSGIGGLSAIRERMDMVPDLPLVRPLLGWRKDELIDLVAEAGLKAVDDPSNGDPRHDRTAMRATLASLGEKFDPLRLARSAEALAEAEEALRFAAERLADERIVRHEWGISLRAADLPAELQRRLLTMAMQHLGRGPARGSDLDGVLATLRAGGRCTLAGALIEGGATWCLRPQPLPRTE